MRFVLIVAMSFVVQVAAFMVALERYLGAFTLSPLGNVAIHDPLTPRSLEEVFLMASGMAFAMMAVGLGWVMLQARHGFAYMLAMGASALMWQAAVRLLRVEDTAMAQAGFCLIIAGAFVTVMWRLLSTVPRPAMTRK